MSAPSQASQWIGHARGSVEYRRLLMALFCAGVATFAQLYSPQAVLPLIAAGLHAGAADVALTVSAATAGLAVGVIPWSLTADRIGRVRAMSLSVVAATVVGLFVPFLPGLPVLLTGRFVEGLLVGGVPAVAIAYLAEEIHDDHTTRAAGVFVAGTSVGGLAGRLIAGPVADVAGWRIGMFTVAVLCGIAAAGFTGLAPRPRGYEPMHRGASRGLGHRLWVNLRSPRQLTLFALAFLLMGGFVAVYNFLGFRLMAAPFDLPQTLVSLVFLAYLAGTWASSRAGAQASRFGRRPVLLASIAIMIVGVLATLAGNVVAVLAGLVLATVGFFGAHAIASGWTGSAAREGKAQASSLYTLFYYAGSSAVGWLAGIAFDAAGWTAVAISVAALAAVAAVLAVLVLPAD